MRALDELLATGVDGAGWLRHVSSTRIHLAADNFIWQTQPTTTVGKHFIFGQWGDLLNGNLAGQRLDTN